MIGIDAIIEGSADIKEKKPLLILIYGGSINRYSFFFMERIARWDKSDCGQIKVIWVCYKTQGSQLTASEEEIAVVAVQRELPELHRFADNSDVRPGENRREILFKSLS